MVFNWEHRLYVVVSNRVNSNAVTHLRTIVSVFGYNSTEWISIEMKLENVSLE